MIDERYSMNLKLKAAGIALGVVGSGIVVGFVMSQLPVWAVGLIVFAFACYIIYSVALSGLKYDKAVEEMNEKYQK
jgi:hypothetical protein